MINISYLPNIFLDDFILTLRTFLKPWQWKEGSAEAELKQKIEEILGAKAYLFASGRGTLWAILKSCGITRGDEVIVQAFTCVAVVSPILALGAKPIYIDIDDNYNLDLNDLRKKITDKTKIIIVQHTFGLPAEIDEIKEIANERNILIVEDLAHSFGGEYAQKKLGSFGDVSFLSFGRSKVISSMFGGAVVVRDTKILLARRSLGEGGRDKDIKLKIEEVINKLDYPTSGWIFKQLFHQLIFYILKPIYSFLNLGKTILFLMSKAKILSREVEEREKNGEMVGELVKKMPNSLCLLTIHQLDKLDFFCDKRREISSYYQENLNRKYYHYPNIRLPYLRFPVEVRDKDRLINFAKKKNIFLGDWYSQPIAPKGVDLNRMKYKSGSCPKVEEANNLVINLPTNPTLTMDKVKKVVEVLNEFSF